MSPNLDKQTALQKAYFQQLGLQFAVNSDSNVFEITSGDARSDINLYFAFVCVTNL